MMCLLGETTVSQGMTAYAAEVSKTETSGAKTSDSETSEAEETKSGKTKSGETKEETKKTTKVEIGKKTSASTYIKAKDWPSGPSVSA